jgi:[NiFe] hydrogenase diaphorase moiety large subunit
VPRIRPPFPVSEGYLGQPTVVNNVETLCKAALIAVRGGAWFAGLGTKQSTGTKLLVDLGRRRDRRDLRIPVRRLR